MLSLEVGDELEEVISDGVGVGLEALLLLRLLLHVPYEGADLLHHCRVRRVLVRQLDAEIEEDELVDVLLVLDAQSEGHLQGLLLGCLALADQRLHLLGIQGVLVLDLTFDLLKVEAASRNRDSNARWLQQFGRIVQRLAGVSTGL